MTVHSRRLTPDARQRLAAAVAALPRRPSGKIRGDGGYIKAIARRFGVSVSAVKMAAGKK